MSKTTTLIKQSVAKLEHFAYFASIDVGKDGFANVAVTKYNLTTGVHTVTAQGSADKVRIPWLSRLMVGEPWIPRYTNPILRELLLGEM